MSDSDEIRRGSDRKRSDLQVGSSLLGMYVAVDTTYNLGNFCYTYVISQYGSSRQANTKNSNFFGPVMVHYPCDTSSYRELFEYIRQELGESTQIIIGSNGEKCINNAIKDVFPNSIHLYCTRHVKKNIERHLLKSQLTLADRQKLLELIFDSPDSLIQAEAEQQYNERLNSLRDVCNGIVSWSSNQNQLETGNFYTWFLRYQNDVFQNHLIAEVRIRAAYVDHHGAAKLYYNNDVESINHVLNSTTNWELLPLSEMIDLLHKEIVSQKNE